MLGVLAVWTNLTPQKYIIYIYIYTYIYIYIDKIFQKVFAVIVVNTVY
jgi:hypothetical protein